MDEDGSIVEAYAYEVYGKPTIKTGTGDDGVWFTEDDAASTTSSLGNPCLFTSRRWEPALSLQYSRARWYAPTPGRWLSRDPLEYADGVNAYEYTLNGTGDRTEKGSLYALRWWLRTSEVVPQSSG